MRIKQITVLTAFLFVGITSFAQQESSDLIIENGIHREHLDLPNKASLLQYCPEIKNQGHYGTAVSWASVYAARTIAEAVKYGWTDKQRITEEAFSPLFVYAQIKEKDDANCNRGSFIFEALRLMKEKGVVKFSDFDDLCASITDIDDELMKKAESFKLDVYSTLFSINEKDWNKKVFAVKKSLSENHPVVISMWLDKATFQETKAVLNLETVDKEFPRKSKASSEGYHAMCVVGYDDNLYGGAFQIMNSWGTDWGDDGFFLAKYDDFARTVDQAYELYVNKKRIALVMGNSYGLNQHFPKLQSAENDAKDFARKLDSLGFDVRQYLNLGAREMEKAIDSFCSEAKDYNVSLLFFTGNGARINHLDCMAANDCEVVLYEGWKNFYSVDEIMRKMKESGCPLRIGMFDMCRLETPTPNHKGSTLLKQRDLGQGEMRIFASERGGVAFDGIGNHSPFYEAIAHVLNTCPEVSLCDFERKVAEYVYEKTKGSQIVNSEKTMIGDFHFSIEKRFIE